MAGKELWLALVVGLPLLLFAWVYYYSLRLQMIRKGAAKLPPGNFWQLPVVGETVQLFKGSRDDFALPRRSKYGTTFRTHVVGSPCICTTTADAAKFVLQSPHLFKSSYDSSTRALVGKGAINEAQGELHARYRKIIQTPMISGALKKFIGQIDRQARQFWEEIGDKAIFNCYDNFPRFPLQVVMLICCEDISLGTRTDEFVQDFHTFVDGFMALPINVPGTAYRRALKARSKLQKFLHHHIQRRLQEKGSTVHDDMLDAFLNSARPDGSKLTHDQIANTILFVLLAGHETTASGMIWAIRNLCLYPKILELVKAENDALARRRKHADDPVTWEDLQELTLTTNVLQETLRIANVVGFTFREATEDVVYNGMLFPKGWKICVWFRYIHLDPEVYTDPLEFNLERFETQPKPNTYTPFGNGNRVCPGRELAMTEMLIFIHRFLTTYEYVGPSPTSIASLGDFPELSKHVALTSKHSLYSFEAIGDLHKTRHWPRPRPKDGLPLRITKRASGPGATK